MDRTSVTDRWNIFRVHRTPALALPFSVRSTGFKRLPAGHGTIDDMAGRPFLQLYWGIEGAFLPRLGDTEFEIGPEQVFVYANRQPHRIRCGAPGATYAWITLDGPLADACVAAFGLHAPWPRHAGPLPTALWDRLSTILADPSAAAERPASQVAFEILHAAAGSVGRPPTDDGVERLRQALVDGCADPDLSVSRLAAAQGDDRSVLTRRFIRVHGLAPKPYLQSLRISRAMTLLHTTDQSVAAIAHACGFNDAGYFARAFRKAAGVTPERFRRE
jgi:AraC-like DNA-binding protein